MYEQHFGLDRRAFAATPDPDCFVPSETSGKALDDLIRCIESGEGIGVLTAPAGVGKTLLCRRLADELGDTFMTVFLANSNFPTRRSLLQAILYELEQPYLRMAEQELRLELTTAVRKVREERDALVLIVDEAHLLSARILEEIRSITNLVDDGVPLVRAVLSGQLLLEENLAEPELASLNQRIACQVSLAPLSHRESAEYVRLRLEWAGGRPTDIFTPQALQIICQASDGSPRCLNQLCDHSLMLGYVANIRPVGPDTVREALEDLKQLPLHWNVPTAIPSPLEQLNAQAQSLRDNKSGRAAQDGRGEVSLRQIREDDLPSGRIEIGSDDESAVAAFEIGGTDDFGSSSSQPIAGEQIRSDFSGTRHIDKTRTAAANTAARKADGFEEEVVVDRYALLDATRPSKRVAGKQNSVKSESKRTRDQQARVESGRKTPSAKELDQALEGIMLMLDDVLETSSGNVNSLDRDETAKIAGSQSDTSLDNRELTISVETDSTGNLRVHDVGFLAKSVVPRAAAGPAKYSTPHSDPLFSSTERKFAFDIVLPDDDGAGDEHEPASLAHTESVDKQLSAGEPAPAAPRPHRPYEQLFSELRRRKGA